MAKQDRGVKRAAEELGVSPKWILAQVAEGVISPARRSGKPNGGFIITDDEMASLKTRMAETSLDPARAQEMAPSESDRVILARITRLEADRTNLLAQVAWARAIAKEQQKMLDLERERAERLAAELEVQRSRVESLKALSTVDRFLGRHKPI